MKKSEIIYFPGTMFDQPRIDERRAPEWAQAERLEYCQPPLGRW
jgi:hypothetical protein